MSRVSVVVVGLMVVGTLALGHCQIPCGIYGDDARFVEIDEHITTIEKSMKKVVELSSAKEQNANQLVRWVNNKEEHAEKIDKIVTYYFMTQRVKPAPEGDKKAQAAYVTKVTLLHKMLVASMKAKQTTDLKHIATLRKLLDDFAKAYGSKWRRK